LQFQIYYKARYVVKPNELNVSNEYSKLRYFKDVYVTQLQSVFLQQLGMNFKLFNT